MIRSINLNSNYKLESEHVTACLLGIVPGNVVLEEVANFEQLHPRVGVGCFALHALFIQRVSRQAAFTSLP